MTELDKIYQALKKNIAVKVKLTIMNDYNITTTCILDNYSAYSEVALQILCSPHYSANIYLLDVRKSYNTWQLKKLH